MFFFSFFNFYFIVFLLYTFFFPFFSSAVFYFTLFLFGEREMQFPSGWEKFTSYFIWITVT